MLIFSFVGLQLFSLCCGAIATVFGFFIATVKQTNPMETERVLVSCPFAGVICTACRVPIVCAGKRTEQELIGQHLRTKTHQEKCDVNLSLQDRKAFLDQARQDLHSVASRLVRLESAQEKRDSFSPFLSAATILWHCPECTSHFRRKKNHGVLDHVPRMVQRTGFVPVGVNSATVVVEPGCDPDNPEAHSKMFRGILANVRPTENLPGASSEATVANQAMVGRRRPPGPSPSEPAAKRSRALTTVTPGSVDNFGEFSPAQGDFFPDVTTPEAILLAATGSSSLDGLDHTDSQLRFLCQLEKFCVPGPNNSWLVEWVCELGYPGIARDSFGNDFVLMSNFMIAGLQKPFESPRWQCAVSPVCDMWLDTCGAQLSKVSPELKGRIMRVGNYDRNISARDTKETLNHVADTFARARESDDPDTDGSIQEFLARDGEDIFNQLLHLTDGDPTASLHQRLRPLTMGTRSRYSAFLQQHVLFLGRCYDKYGGNLMWSNVVKPALNRFQEQAAAAATNNRAGLKSTSQVSKAAFAAINWLLLSTCELDRDPQCSDSVQFRSTLPGLFARSSALEGVNDTNGPIFTHHSPYRVQQSSAAMMHCLRLSFVIAMVHASETNDKSLQKLVSKPNVLVQSTPMLDLANVSRICRIFSSQVQLGAEKAIVAKSNPSLPQADIFTFEGSSTRITQGMLQRAVSDLFRSSKTLLEDLLLDAVASASTTSDVAVAGLSNEDFAFKLCEGVLSSPPIFVASHDADHCVKTHEKVCNDTATATQIKIHAAATAATFQLGDDSDIESGEVCDLIVRAGRADEDFLGSLDSIAEELTLNLSTLVLLCVRGQGRPREVNSLRCGSTNLMQAAGTRPDIFPVSDGPNSALSRLKIQFKSCKDKSAQGEPMKLPEEIGRLVGAFLAIVRVAQVKSLLARDPTDVDASNLDFLGKQLMWTGGFRPDFQEDHELRRDAVTGLVNWATKIRLAPSKATVETMDLNTQVEGALNRCFGLAAGALTMGMFRQVMSSVASAILPSMSAAKLGQVNRSAAQSFNHSAFAHAMNCMANLSNDPNRRVAASVAEAGECLDYLHGSRVGALGWQLRPGNGSIDTSGTQQQINKLDDWRVLRCLSSSEALGLVKIGSLFDAEARSSQVAMLQETVSALRDSLNACGCGSGKTCLIWGFAAYQFTARLAQCSSCEDMREMLRRRFEEKHRDLSVVDALLADSDAKAIIQFAEGDSHKIFPFLKVIVIVPFVAAANDLVTAVNDTCLTRCIQWNAESDQTVRELLDNAALAAKAPSLQCDFGPIDVFIAATACAMQPSTFLRMEKAMANDRTIALLCLDEVHSVLRNVSFQPEMIKVRSAFRGNVPIVGITGTLHHLLEKPLCDSLFSSVGSPSEEVSRASREEVRQSCQLSGNSLVAARNRFVDCRGSNRAESTVPLAIQHIKVDLAATLDPFSPEAFSKLINFISQVSSELECVMPQNADRILVVLPKRELVDTIKALAVDKFGANNVATLVGGEGIEATAEFNRKWTRGDHKCGFGTTAVAQCLNNRSCNFVIVHCLCCGADTHLQASARAGRANQPSTCVFLHSDRALQVARAVDQASTSTWCSQVARGIDVDQPEVKRALSLESMTKFLANRGTTCRRVRLMHEIDGHVPETSANASVVQGRPWCCDVCDPEMKQYFNELWNSAIETERVVQHDSPLAAPVRGQRVVRNPCDMSRRVATQRELFHERQQASRDAQMESDRRRMEDRVRAFVNMRGGPHQRHRCHWHAMLTVFCGPSLGCGNRDAANAKFVRGIRHVLQRFLLGIHGCGAQSESERAVFQLFVSLHELHHCR